MIPNNNLSVLPWYKSIDQQNARRWWIYNRIYPLYVQAGYMLPFQIMRDLSSNVNISNFRIYRADGSLFGNYTTQLIEQGVNVIRRYALGYDILVYGGQTPIFPTMPNGQYYARLDMAKGPWYSEIFTVVNDIEPYLKIEWWDKEDFVMDGGTIVYNYANGTQFKNVLYLPSDIAKPEYNFEEEGEERDGYFYPMKQISSKRYRFNFLASEYLLDVMRLIRMADYVEITYHGQRYSLDTFLMTPEWEESGDVAVVEAQFTCATVAKKIGTGYVKSLRGDYNDDFNNDFNNQ